MAQPGLALSRTMNGDDKRTGHGRRLGPQNNEQEEGCLLFHETTAANTRTRISHTSLALLWYADEPQSGTTKPAGTQILFHSDAVGMSSRCCGWTASSPERLR